MAFVYILHSEINNSFYIGSCKNLDSRLKEHYTKYFDQSYTSTVNDWQLFLAISDLNYSQARKIEVHIKRMKSKKYITNLKTYPDIINKLILQYN